MYIKNITLENFKSYRSRTDIQQPFDPRHNIVVGFNGAGKSNLLAGVQFVLSKKYYCLDKNEREALLYDKTQNAVITVTFDNSDKRIPIETNEVSVCRVINTSKDQFLINGKNIGRNKYFRLLEFARIFINNPFYMIKQGQITKLAAAPDAYRLQLLHEITGVATYDKDINKTTSILTKSDSKMTEVQELLKCLETHFYKLKDETEELVEYQHFDKMKRALEYVISQNEEDRNERKSTQFKTELEQLSMQREELLTRLVEYEESIMEQSKKIKSTEINLLELKIKFKHENNRYEKLIKEKIERDIKTKELEEEIKREEVSKTEFEKKLVEVNESIIENESEYKKVKSEYDAVKEKEEEYVERLKNKEQNRNSLYDKEGRTRKFSSKDERDKWIKNELTSINEQLKNTETLRDKLIKDIEEDQGNENKLKEKVGRLIEEIQSLREKLEEYNTTKKCSLLKKKISEQAAMEELSRKELDLQKQMISLKEDLTRAKEELRSLVPKEIKNGLDSVQKVLDTFISRAEQAKIAESYYSTVIMNLDCDDALNTAIEVTAKNELFNHIVETDTVASEILKEMNQQKLPGSVKFMPLNQLSVRSLPQYLRHPDFQPLVSLIKYDEKYKKVMHFLFANTLVCRNLETATREAKNSHFNCVTLDGDQVSYKGVLTGGYINKSRSRLHVQKRQNAAMMQFKQCESQLNLIRTEKEHKRQLITGIIDEMQELEADYNKNRVMYDKMRCDLRLMKEELASFVNLRTKKTESLAQYKLNTDLLQTNKAVLESELEQELLSQLSETEQNELHRLNEEILELHREIKEIKLNLSKLEASKSKFDNTLRSSLIPQRDETSQVVSDFSLEDHKRQLAELQIRTKTTDTEIEKYRRSSVDANKNVKETSDQLKNERKEYKALEESLRKVQEEVVEKQKEYETVESKQEVLKKNVADYDKHLKQPEVLPPQDLVEEYLKIRPNELFKKLKYVHENLKKFNVNEMAIDEFTYISENIERLQNSMEGLQNLYNTITVVIDMLRPIRLNVVRQGFAAISHNFTEVFKQLVASGHATLVMKTIQVDESQTESKTLSSSDIESDMENVDISGVGIKVSFTSLDAHEQSMKQLSGGQKTVVAIAFIFGMQKYKPTPFYLFDEIDQALDTERRKALANLICKLSKDTQFIMTTFRPELLKHANKFYRVLPDENGNSCVECIPKTVAETFVKQKRIE